MKYFSLLLLASVVCILWACTENINSSVESIISEQDHYTYQTNEGTISFEANNPSGDLLRTFRKNISYAESLTRNAATCEPPCDLLMRRILTTTSNDCGATDNCLYRIEIGFCYQEVSNGTVEIFFGEEEFEIISGCDGVDEDCVKAEAIRRISSAITNSIYQFIPNLPDPVPCDGPIVNWFSTYSQASCSSNCSEVDCGDACCQFYSSWCQKDGDLLLSQFEGSNQISDCSGNSNLPEGCECFQTDCENQYDF